MRLQAAIGALGLTLTMLPMAKAVAQTAGRVVMAVGDVAVVRANERTNDRVKLAQGAEVRVGDRVTTGPQSHAQLRFSDEALVALRPDSEFHIDGYSFQSPGSGPERAVFRLVKGGFRTVTGQIGRINRDQYQVLTSQATIGIRGTGIYVEAEPERTYVCTCYGIADIEANDKPESRETVSTTHHEQPRYIYGKSMPSVRMIEGAPLKNHSDAELIMLEALVGRRPPFLGTGVRPY